MRTTRTNHRPKIKSLVLGIAISVSSSAVCIQSAAAATASHFNGTGYNADASWSGTSNDDCIVYNLSVSLRSLAHKSQEVVTLLI